MFMSLRKGRQGLEKRDKWLLEDYKRKMRRTEYNIYVYMCMYNNI
jgi:hypothetical protein